MRRGTLEAYKQTFLVPRQADRTTGSLFESGYSEARRLRCPSIGRQGANLSSFVERIVRAHLEDYAEEIEEWRKL